MPPKPTCKVVKREGQRGARIDPKGCKVRTTKDAQGNKKKENKQGQQKIKRTTTKTDMRLAFAGSPQRHLIANWNDRPQNFRSNYKRNHNMVYDTGANMYYKCTDGENCLILPPWFSQSCLSPLVRNRASSGTYPLKSF